MPTRNSVDLSVKVSIDSRWSQAFSPITQQSYSTMRSQVYRSASYGYRHSGKLLLSRKVCLNHQLRGQQCASGTVGPQFTLAPWTRLYSLPKSGPRLPDSPRLALARKRPNPRRSVLQARTNSWLRIRLGFAGTSRLTGGAGATRSGARRPRASTLPTRIRMSS